MWPAKYLAALSFLHFCLFCASECCSILATMGVPSHEEIDGSKVHVYHLGTTPDAPASPSPHAQSEVVAPLPILQLRNQLQRIEASTEELHFSSDDENDVFDWQSPIDHLYPIGPTSSKPAVAVPILSPAPTPANSAIADRPTPDSPARRKGKAPTGRTIARHAPSSPDEEEQMQRPAKRQRRYHIITADSDDDSGDTIPVAQPEKSVDPSLSSTF
ncbi:hypothetical protein V6N12_030530 [Hibiscus sabdariffa]|uniref:Secreted protein n=1 Tax=Hibiscus sabdariffa TaxID=183260 RepID=A0ABR2BDC3_9ROSI